MTVRVNKPSLNIREKLSELERPIGLKGGEIMAADTAQEARELVSAGRKNMIINGAMLISQRYSSAQSIPSGSQPYFLDRFSNRNNTDASASVSHSSEAPDGFYRSMRIEVTSPDTSLASNQYMRFQQYIEGHNMFCDWGVGNTDYVTLSFWVRSSLPGIYSASLEDGDAIPLHIKEYEIDNADTWEYKTLTFPPPPTGTFRTAGTSTGMRLTMVQSSGTQNQSSPNNWKTGSYYHASTNQVNFVGQTGNFYITGIQLEVGKNATEFEHRSYGEELALCKRYYQRMGDTNTNEIVLGGYSVNGSNIYHSIQLPVEMRIVPTLSQVGTFYSVRTNQPGSLSGHRGRKGFGVAHTTTQDGNFLLASNTTAYFVLDAEL